MGRIVIVAYRARPGQEQALKELIGGHVPLLRSQSLVTDRDPVVMRSRDGIYVEVFEWRSGQAIEAAHGNQAVQELWERFAKVCDYIPIAEVEESQTPFSEFEPVSFG